MKYLLLIITLLVPFVCISQTIKIEHKSYYIKFDTIIHEPILTYYVIDSSELINRFSRSSFKVDKSVSIQGKDSDYKSFIYDKGHLAPNDDFRFDSISQIESMYYTNCAPQNRYLNRGVWKSLENHVRDLAKYYTVEVWTGCIYGNRYSGSLRIPSYYWKVIKYNGVYESYKMPNSRPKFKDYGLYLVDSKIMMKYIK